MKKQSRESRELKKSNFFYFGQKIKRILFREQLSIVLLWAFQMALMAKNLPANARDARDAGSIPRLGRSLGEGNGNPLQYSCLENPMDRGAWLATVHGIAESDKTEHKQACTHTHAHTVLLKNCFYMEGVPV